MTSNIVSAGAGIGIIFFRVQCERPARVRGRSHTPYHSVLTGFDMTNYQLPITNYQLPITNYN